MEELGFSGSKGVSPVGVSGPFSLFSAEAVHQMRKGVLNPEMGKKYEYSSNLAQCQLRGYAAESRAPLVDNAPKSPETLEIVSIIAGVNLVTAMDFEIGHINFSMSSEED
ncbi:Aminopeptidase 2 [Penicillium digitatum]|uniref:Aminopeptidase 2 n=1 Tax=Penicillium digitatum TaxID=36651 RepID=A0A7T7BM10_PENDI|nr:Aminopeptidase 2 [Penicillium digitatum]